jgi:8-oxo-dGTP diphosphatase
LPYTYPYPRPSVTVDVALFAIVAGELAVLLVQRGHAPFEGAWAMPGGFVDENEPLARAALRELDEETGVRGVTIEQLGAFGDPGRDPRGHTVSVVFVGFASAEAHPVTAGDDAAHAAWHPVAKLGARGRTAPKLAFDHGAILPLAVDRLRQALRDPAEHPVARAIVPPRFTLRELSRVVGVVLGGEARGRALVAELRKQGKVEPAGRARGASVRRASQLHRWRRGRSEAPAPARARRGVAASGR